MAEEQQSEFQVVDRRRITAEGDLKEGAVERPAPSAPTPPPAEARPPKAAAPFPAATQPTPPLAGVEDDSPRGQASRKYREAATGFETITFDRLLLSYYQTALIQLGLLSPDPNRPLEPDLMGARETIDVLGILQEKTRGNLTPDEERILEKSLYELRMAWMEISRRYTKKA